MAVIQPRPARNPSIVGAGVYSHSGAFTSAAQDLRIPGRDIDLGVLRTYYSGGIDVRYSFGPGWASTYAQSVRREGKDIVYQDGVGAEYRFVRSKHGFRTPHGLYGSLHISKTGVELHWPYGVVFRFDALHAGGRLTGIANANGNRIQLTHNATQTELIDTLGNHVVVSFQNDLITQIVDHIGRTWTYVYDANRCLTQVVRPALAGSPTGTTLRYSYDASLRLTTITNPNSVTVLRNYYAASGRVVQQDHGTGTFKFQYSLAGGVHRTQVTQKNGATLVIAHDHAGHARERVLYVSASAFSPEDRVHVKNGRVPVRTVAKFNVHGELVESVGPDGDRTIQKYAERDPDPRARGNLLRRERRPSPKLPADQKQLTWSFRYERRFQRCREQTDPRGHTTSFQYDRRGNLVKTRFPAVRVPDLRGPQRARYRVSHLVERQIYNASGQLTEVIDPRGSVTQYRYYPAIDPWGSNPSTIATEDGTGYLGLVVRDAPSPHRRLKTPPTSLTRGFGYDQAGNAVWSSDGTGNRATMTYDALDRITSTTSRAPFLDVTTYQRDANGNVIEVSTDFQRYVADAKGVTTLKTETRQVIVAYDALDSCVSRSVASAGSTATTMFQRDANENVVKITLPTGNVTELKYDERDLLVEKTFAAGSSEPATASYTSTRSGNRRTITDPNGNVRRFEYDGYQRYVGFVDADGTKKRRHFDGNGNLVEATFVGPLIAGGKGLATLKSTRFEYDALNRRVRIDRSWHDPATGRALGRSRWDGRKGVSSSLIKYAGNGRPARTWDENDNVREFEYDGANLLIASWDQSGQILQRQYDANGNLVRQDQLGPKGPQRHYRITSQRFDALDRMIARWVNNEPPETLTYNSLGSVLTQTNAATGTTFALHDEFGRRAGRVRSILVPSPMRGAPTELRAVSRLQWDSADRLIAYTNASGHTTKIDHDARGNRKRIAFPDGSVRTFERDANGNVTRIVEPNGTTIVQTFDSRDRVTERRAKMTDGRSFVECYAYDGLRRAVSATSSSTTVTRRFDSLSRMLSETGDAGGVAISYDGMGNRTTLAYPSGARVHKSYDILGRVSEVRDEKRGLIARYEYSSRFRRRSMALGSGVRTDFAYTPGRNRIVSIVYQKVSDGETVVGSSYTHDVLGNQTSEQREVPGAPGGDRFLYDSSSRLATVQYDVTALDDPASPYAQAVQFQRNPLGRWSEVRTLDSSGNIVDDVIPTTNARDRYVTFGTTTWGYDLNGNRTSQTVAGGGRREYTYDFAHRLVRVVDLAPNGEVVQTIDYTYDAFGRQIGKRKTQGKTVESTTRVWAGRQLLEEHVDGAPARVYAYGGQSSEVLRITSGAKRSATHFYLAYNGRRSVNALLDASGNVLERYEYDALGQPRLGGIVITAGVSSPSAAPRTATPASPAGNVFFAGGQLFDDDVALQFVGPTAFDPVTDGPINASDRVSGPQVGRRAIAEAEPPANVADDPTGENADTSDAPDEPGLKSSPGGSAVIEGIKAGVEIIGGLIIFGTIGWEPLVVGAGAWLGEQIIDWASELTPSDIANPLHIGDDWIPPGSQCVDESDKVSEDPGVSMQPSNDEPETGPVDSTDGEENPQENPQGPDAGADQPPPPDAGSPPNESNQSTDQGANQSTDPGTNQSTEPGTGNQSVDPGAANQSSPGDPSMSPGPTEPTDGGIGESGGEDGYPGGAFSAGEDSGLGAAGGGGCFVAGTPIWTRGGTVPIEQLDVADEVITFDFDKRSSAVNSVLELHRAERSELLMIDFGSEVLRCTPAHRFYRDGWIEARELRPGDAVLCHDGELQTIASITRQREALEVYNLTVHQTRNYCVGSAGIIVHNDKVENGGYFNDNPDNPLG